MPRFLQIFRKDVRRLTPFLLAIFALQAVFAIGTIHSVGFVDTGERLENILGFIEAILFLCWGFLIAIAILEDPLVGDNAFWLTRPYSWRSLFAAKVLFVLTFLNLPLLISDCVILRTLSLPFDLPHLLLRQLPLIALVILPLFAFAAIASRLSQFWLFIVIALVGMAVGSFAIGLKFPEGLNLIRIPDTLALGFISLCALPAITIQFSRRVNYTRIWLGALFALTIPVIFATTHLLKSGAYFIQRHPQTTAGNPWRQVHLDFGRARTDTPQSPNFNGAVWLGLNIPVRVQGLPPGVILAGEGETFLGDSPKSFHSSLIYESGGSYYLALSRFHAPVLRNMNILIRSSLQVWVLSAQPTYKKTFKRYETANIPDVGICQFPIQLICWNGPLHPPSVTVATKSWTKLFPPEPDSLGMDNDDDLYHEMVWDLSPIGKRTLMLNESEETGSGDEVTFAPHFVIGAFHADLRDDHFPLFDARPEFGTPYMFKNPTP